uniref:Uncharacterized protein n=1 Tax=Plectus sambesii TaxID=2011161 RepID=A0A914WEI0_9BILA
MARLRDARSKDGRTAATKQSEGEAKFAGGEVRWRLTGGDVKRRGGAKWNLAGRVVLLPAGRLGQKWRLAVVITLSGPSYPSWCVSLFTSRVRCRRERRRVPGRRVKDGRLWLAQGGGRATSSGAFYCRRGRRPPRPSTRVLPSMV